MRSIEDDIYMNKNRNIQKYQMKIFEDDIKINKKIRNYDNVILELEDYEVKDIDFSINSKERNSNKKEFFKTLNMILNDINNIKVNEKDFNLELYDLSKLKMDFSIKLKLMDYWNDLQTKNVITNNKNYERFKTQFNIDFISYISLMIGLINRRNISLHIIITAKILHYNLKQLMNIDIKEILMKTMKYEQMYGETQLILSNNVNYNFDNTNIKYYIEKNFVREMLLPIDNNLILRLENNDVVSFCLQYNYFLHTGNYLEIIIEKTIETDELTEEEEQLRKLLISDDEEIRDAFLQMKETDDDD
jgi:hypothetical protein